MIYFAIAAGILLIALFCHYQNNTIDVTEHTVFSDKIGESVKLVHLSDLHSKPFFKVIDITKELKPDIIMITGDFINDRCKRKDKMLEFGKELLKIAPVFYITGNHERRLECFDELMKELKNTGFTVLLNEISEIKVNGNLISVLGLDENQASFEAYSERKKGIFEYKDMRPYFEEFDLHGGFKIVLSHFPEDFEAVKEMNYSQYDFDIQLSGHAHGGQFILPFIGPVFSPGQGFFPKYARGAKGEKPKLIISRGLGNSEFPLRLFNHPEINVITLMKPQK
ncbi:MAG: metallophosphoesterase [Eubacterium sp.]|nr:metallophosphoesterase [Eubacterium sp.]